MYLKILTPQDIKEMIHGQDDRSCSKSTKIRSTIRFIILIIQELDHHYFIYNILEIRILVWCFK